jgi:deoxycytidylate deaminase
MAGRRRRLDSDHPRRAWLVRSLRRPEEVQFLRQVYRPRFVLLGIHAPEALRLHNLTNRRREKSPSTSGPFEVGAIEDIKHDEQDVTVPDGQSMRTTFAEADFVVDSRSDEALKATLGRTIDILFGDPFATPTSDEQAMAHAYAAGVRSAEMGRQVGAALVDARGDIIATGTNEVPSGGGASTGPVVSPTTVTSRSRCRSTPTQSGNAVWRGSCSRGSAHPRAMFRGSMHRACVSKTASASSTTSS